jgi:hypothetical protein
MSSTADEVKDLKEKLARMATQFDSELSDRDRNFKAFT